VLCCCMCRLSQVSESHAWWQRGAAQGWRNMQLLKASRQPTALEDKGRLAEPVGLLAEPWQC
jgi:hypothetical protein